VLFCRRGQAPGESDSPIDIDLDRFGRGLVPDHESYDHRSDSMAGSNAFDLHRFGPDAAGIRINRRASVTGLIYLRPCLVFAVLLGYSRVPFAAATDGRFFAIFGRLHRTKTSLIFRGVHRNRVRIRVSVGSFRPNHRLIVIQVLCSSWLRWWR